MCIRDRWRCAVSTMTPTPDVGERDVAAEITQLLDLDLVVGKDAEEVVPPPAQSPVSGVGALHRNQARLDLNLVVRERHKGIPVPSVERAGHCQCALDVLLRHRPPSIAPPDTWRMVG